MSASSVRPLIHRVAVTVMPLPDTRFGASAPAGSPVVTARRDDERHGDDAHPARRAGGAGANGSAADRA